MKGEVEGEEVELGSNSDSEAVKEVEKEVGIVVEREVDLGSESGYAVLVELYLG